MAMDFAKLVNPPQWVFQSEAAGKWDVHSYSMGAMKQVEKYSSGKITHPIDAVRAIMGVMCKTHPDDQKDDSTTPTEPTTGDLAAFTEEDINSFSRQFLKHDNSFDAEKKLEKVEGQSDAEFFLKVLVEENNKQNAMMHSMVSSWKTSLDGLVGSKNSGIRSAAKTLRNPTEILESQYNPKTFKLRDPPSNPFDESNVHLGDITERLANLVRFGENALPIMTGLQVASLEFLEIFSTEAEKNSKAVKKAVGVSIVAVLIAVLLPVIQIGYTEFWRVPQDTAAMDAALASVRGEINELQTALVIDLTSLQSAQTAATAAVADSVNSTGETNTAILQRIDLLLQQQQVLIEALEAMSETVRNPAE
jgi:hypothetical protein